MSQHRRGGRSSAALGNHRLDGHSTHRVKAETVLATSDSLERAFHASTKDGKARIDGLYAPDGSKVQEVLNRRAAEGGEAREDTRDVLAMSRVAKGHRQRQAKLQRRAQQAHKHVTELEDEESAQRAKSILGGCTDAELVQFRELFNFFDADKDRTWGSIEFAQRMTDIGFPTNVETASNLLFFAGVRDVDRVTFEDFVQLMPKLKAFRQLLEKDAMRCFAAQDVYGRGWINSKATRAILQQMAGPDGLDEDQATRILKAADKERVDMITFDGFIRALFGTPPLLVYKPRRRGLFAMLCGGGARRDDLDDLGPDAGRL